MTEIAATTGPRLKAERERRGLSLQKAADELHLDGWVIAALENEDYARIGPSVYAKGHLKRYAALLGLPPAEIMAGYESRAQAPKPVATQPAGVRLRTDATPKRDLPWPQIAVSVVVGLLILGLLWWRPWHPRAAPPVNVETVAANPGIAPADDSTGPAGPAAEPAPAQGSTPASNGSSPSPSQPAPQDAGAASGAATPAGADATAGTGRARLRLSFSADSWVDVYDATGRRAFSGNGRANSVKTIAGVAPMRVYLGYASGVQLEINNRAVAIGPQFMAGDVARFEAGADGVLRRDSHSPTTPGVQPRNARPIG